MALKTYRAKRDFKKTPEPAGAGAATRAPGDPPRFVIQKHAASHLHYDFRLELGGVLKSWAVPKGVPFAKGEKRLAMEVEDHPLSYRLFEGVIPKGQYGGGTVMVWDFGTFEPAGKSPLKDLAGGKLHFTLSGKKLAGEWYLVRTGRTGAGQESSRQWLLIRGGANMKPPSRKADDTSALSGKTMAALRKTGEASSTSSSTSSSTPSTPSTSAAKPAAKKGNPPQVASPRSAPRTPALKTKPSRTARASTRVLPFFEPMMAKLVSAPPPGEWLYEIKLDGYRALAFLDGAGVKLLSRNNKDLAGKFPEVADSLARLKARATVLDGEIVAMNRKGISSFQLLQRRELGVEAPPLFYYAFDMPQHEGEDLRAVPLEERRARLAKRLRKPVGVVRFSETVGTNGDALAAEAGRLGLEGLIGKRAGSVYETGRRSGSWIKLKTHREQEFVIGGYTDPSGSRRHMGALLVGVREGRALVFTGKVGTGFDDAMLRLLRRRFAPLARATCPFANLPESSRGRYGSGLTATEMARCHWLKPVLVAQVKFAEWTEDGKLRQPVFLGLREDKDPARVRREEAADAG